MRANGDDHLFSTPKLEIEWRELSVLLKTPETTRKSQAKSISNYTVVASLHNSGLEDRNINNFYDEKKDKSFLSYKIRQRSISQSPTCDRKQSGRLARLEQGRQARKLLDAIDPDIFLNTEAKENSNHKKSPKKKKDPNLCHYNKIAFPNTSLIFTTPPRPTTYIREHKTSAKKVLFSPTPPRHPNSTGKKAGLI
jgi:hypothetical protein